MEEYIVNYLNKKYNPLSIIIYGSYSNNSFDEFSDFDCIIIVDKKIKGHDNTKINNVVLDCFIYTVEEVNTMDLDNFVPIYFGNIIKDNGLGEELKKRVIKYVLENSITDLEEKNFIKSWYKKTLRRIEKNDDEANYRALIILLSSLEDYYKLRDMFYFGSKLAIEYLKKNDVEGYILFKKAIENRKNSDIIEWIKYTINF